MCRLGGEHQLPDLKSVPFILQYKGKITSSHPDSVFDSRPFDTDETTVPEQNETSEDLNLSFGPEYRSVFDSAAPQKFQGMDPREREGMKTRLSKLDNEDPSDLDLGQSRLEWMVEKADVLANEIAGAPSLVPFEKAKSMLADEGTVFVLATAGEIFHDIDDEDYDASGRPSNDLWGHDHPA